MTGDSVDAPPQSACWALRAKQSSNAREERTVFFIKISNSIDIAIYGKRLK